MVCSHLDVPQNGALHGTDTSHGSIVVASCLPGFMFADSNLAQQLQCISVGYPQPVAVWNASISDCQRLYHAYYIDNYRRIKFIVYIVPLQ